jgi:hypothetical protein
MWGGHQWDMRWGTTSPRCAPCASSSGEKEKGGDGVHLPRRRASDVPTRKRTRGRGVRYGNESENSRDDKRAEERGRTVQWRGECGAMLWPREHDSRGPRHRRLPQDTVTGTRQVYSGHRAQGQRPIGVPNTLDHWWLFFL